VRAAIWQEPGRLEIGHREDPAPGPGELVVQVGACGLCGTDVHIADGEFPPTPYPLMPGHEFAGEVVAAGAGVQPDAGLRVGARVAVDPSLFCRRCTFCRAGRGNLCADWNAIGDTVDGAFAEYVRVVAANATRCPRRSATARGRWSSRSRARSTRCTASACGRGRPCSSSGRARWASSCCSSCCATGPAAWR
jgi:D-arabinose 1-dehydrogenase-like Zn-dependent alcohol dehydrogenase